MDNLKILPFYIDEKIHKFKGVSNILDVIEKVKEVNIPGHWTMTNEGLYKRGGNCIQVEINGKFLSDILFEDLGLNIYDDTIPHLGSTLFFQNFDLSHEKIILSKYLGIQITDQDIDYIFNNFNNKNRSIDEIKNILEEENKNEVVFLQCRCCGDFDCGIHKINISKDINSITWDLSQLYGKKKPKIGKLRYTFDLKDYKDEVNKFEYQYIEFVKNIG